MSTKNNSMEVPRIKKSEIVFDESLIKIRKDQLQMGSNKPYIYYSMVSYPLAVAVIAKTSEGLYVLTKEYRHPTGKMILGCPGGFIDENENCMEAAQRELLEETGYEAKTYTYLGEAYPYAGFSGQKTIYIAASEATPLKKQTLEVSEIIQPILMSSDQLKSAIGSKMDLDGNLCTALFFHQFSI